MRGSGVGTEFARAKLNLALHVTGRRPDGYHEIDSLVVFPFVGDTVTVTPWESLSVEITGPFAAGLSAEDNLVLRAARLIDPDRGSTLLLQKNLPVAAGLGGGSADAAATLRLLSRAWDLPLPSPEAVLALGADVPACLGDEACRVQGIGERLTPVALARFAVVLANPGLPVPTAAVFAGLTARDNAPLAPLLLFMDFERLVSYLGAQRNDLEAAGIALAPPIATCRDALAALPGCRLARMSGSGATCFGLFATDAEAEAAAQRLRLAEPGWWVAAAPVM